MSEQGYFMFSSQPKTKAKQNCVAYAAYCADEKLFDESEDRMHKFKEHGTKPISFIMKPSHAPDWTLNREKLWNEVKKNEKGINWRTHRDMKLSLPVGFPKEHYVDMTKEFVEKNLTEQGMVADVSIHLDHEHNPHVHILCTVRPFNEDGTWGDKKNKIAKVDENGEVIRNEKGRIQYKTVSLTNWDSKEFLESLRESWANIHNKYAEINKSNERFDHRSYEKQGLDLVATRRLSRRNYELEKQEKLKAKELNIPYVPVTEWGKINEEIRQENEPVKLKMQLESQLIQDTKDIFNRNIKTVESNLNDIQKQSIKVAIRKSKDISGSSLSDINYTAAKKLNDSMNPLQSKWNDYLQRQKIDIDTQKKFYQLVNKKYKENPKSVEVYGIPSESEKYNEFMRNKASELKDIDSKYQSQASAYSSEKESASFVLKVQTAITERTFEELYGKEVSAGFTTDEKAYAIDNALSGKYIMVDSIKDMYQENKQTTNDIDYVKLARNYQKSLLITERLASKIQKDIKANEVQPNHQSFLDLLRTRELKNHYNDVLEQVRPNMINQIKNEFELNGKFIDTEELSEMSNQDLISYYQNDEDIQRKENQYEEDKRTVNGDDWRRKEQSYNENESSNNSNVAGGMLGSLGQLGSNEQADVKEKKTKKNRKKRHKDDDLYKDFER
ncbi:MobA/MobL family protein [Priestia aryabhattai]|uniref:MobA/MobL family protein n=1 Tax=Priestia aryabhattai TaxID=412384 RepID=UPI001C8E46FD|nr:MobA/MobL family protein [Priestia aryabhattai]MBX9998184.1 MobA/MobL family protein [Priestia aryabhattai]